MRLSKNQESAVDIAILLIDAVMENGSVLDELNFARNELLKMKEFSKKQKIRDLHRRNLKKIFSGMNTIELSRRDVIEGIPVKEVMDSKKIIEKIQKGVVK